MPRATGPFNQPQTRRDFLKSVGMGAAALTLPGCLNPPLANGKRPNILFIMTDDHARQAMSCYGSRINRTPNMDRIAVGGVRFDEAFCTNSICAPSRAVLLTGKYSHVNGLVDNAVPFDGEQQTMPKLLQAAGYETALFGKWHLKTDPTGFDHWHILPGQGHYYNPDFIRMGEKHRRKGYVSDLVTEDCLDWLKSRTSDKPFCVLLHHKAPHRSWMPDIKHLDMFEDEDVPVPETFFDDYETRSAAAREQAMTVANHMYAAYDLKVAPPEQQDGEPGKVTQDRRWWASTVNRLDDEQRRAWDAAYERRRKEYRAAEKKGGRELALYKYQCYIKDYLRCIASVDENVGRVLDYLRDSGLEEDTLVVYTSDQGFYLGEHGWYDKRFMYEESLRIPLVMRYPRAIPAGSDADEMVINADFAPTFLALAGVSIPADMQGRSLMGIAEGRKPADWRQSIYYHYYEYPGAHSVKRHYGVRTQRYKLVHFYHDIDAWELYDLEKDPNELQNVIDDPAYAEVRRELEAELERLREVYGDNDNNRFRPQAKVTVDHMAVGCPVTLAAAYSPKYAGGGPGALTDGRRGPDVADFKPDYGLWQGFEGIDMEATVDLGSTKNIKRIGAGFLNNVQEWIFLPRSVEFAVSEDGKTFTKAAEIKNKIPIKRKRIQRHEFSEKFENLRGRYVRVRARGVGVCPEWHHGAGGKAWIFADEIFVE